VLPPSQLGLPPVAAFGLEMSTLERNPQDLESERIETDSDGVQKTLTIIERIETRFGKSSIYFYVFVNCP
jgi:hypothetical protein